MSNINPYCHNYRHYLLHVVQLLITDQSPRTK